MLPYGKINLALWLCLCSLASWSQPTALRFSANTWNGHPPLITRSPGTIIINEDNGSIAIQGRHWKQTFRIIRKVLEDDGVTVYGCETKFRSGRVHYIIKHDSTRRTLTLYPYNQYLKTSTIFRLNPP